MLRYTLNIYIIYNIFIFPFRLLHFFRFGLCTHIAGMHFVRLLLRCKTMHNNTSLLEKIEKKRKKKQMNHTHTHIYHYRWASNFYVFVILCYQLVLFSVSRNSCIHECCCCCSFFIRKSKSNALGQENDKILMHSILLLPGKRKNELNEISEIKITHAIANYLCMCKCLYVRSSKMVWIIRLNDTTQYTRLTVDARMNRDSIVSC